MSKWQVSWQLDTMKFKMFEYLRLGMEGEGVH